jgi:immunity protein, SdpI family
VVAIVPALSLLFWIIGMLLPRTELNWMIGIRTPWTISSEDVWKKTHRAGGTWFKICAIIGLLGVVIPSEALWFLLVPVLAVAVGLVVYSYILYEREKKA